MAYPPGTGAPCPCGSGLPFALCCGPLLAGERSAATARELMRSRFTAHAIGDEAYLHRTDAKTAPRPYRAAKPAGPRTHWTRLVIHDDRPGSSPEIGYVEFSAFYRDASGEHEMREHSEFRRIDGQWLYTRAIR